MRIKKELSENGSKTPLLSSKELQEKFLTLEKRRREMTRWEY